MPVQWTTNAQQAWPAAADGVTVTPGGATWGNSAYVTLVASTSFASLLTGIVVRTARNQEEQFEIDIATGAASSEVVIATFKGVSHQLFSNVATAAAILKLVIPCDNIAASVRVSCRIRTGSTDTTTWNIAATYLDKPITGNLQVTANAQLVAPSAANVVSATSPASAWTNSTYTTVLASTGADVVVTGAIVIGNPIQYEIDLAKGGVGSEVVFATLHGFIENVAGAASYIPFPTPYDNITSGSRISFRTRNSTPFAIAMRCGVTYYNKPL